MKKYLCSVAAVAAIAGALALGACSSIPNVQQQFVSACGVVNADLPLIAQLPVAQADRDFITKTLLPANEALCTSVANAKLNATDLKTFHDQLLPAAVAIVNALPPTPTQQAAMLALVTIGPIVQQLVDSLIVVVAPTPASAPAAASAPLAASGA